MTQTDLKTIFPTAQLIDFPPQDLSFIGVPYQEQYLWLKRSELSERELLLLEAFLPQNQLVNRQTPHRWYGILFEGSSLVQKEQEYRILQIRVAYLEELNDYQKLWQDSLKEFFPKLVDGFFITDQEFILVEEKTKNSFTMDEIEGVFTTLDDDFSLESTVFVGEFYQDQEDIPGLFNEERQMFLEEVQTKHDQRIFHFADVALHYYTKDKLAVSKLANYFSKQMLLADDSFTQLVEMMWRFSGNISSVAKEMFTHRNTINYRVEKIAEQSGINLKKPDDLAFMYLLTLKNQK